MNKADSLLENVKERNEEEFSDGTLYPSKENQFVALLDRFHKDSLQAKYLTHDNINYTCFKKDKTIPPGYLGIEEVLNKIDDVISSIVAI